jgi:hypothetical protein
MAQDWLTSYYNAYVKTANAAGVTPISKNDYYQKYVIGPDGGANYEGGRVAYEAELFPIIKEKINTVSQQIANLTGGDYIPYEGANDRESLLNALNSVNSQYKFQSDRAYNQYVKDTKASGGTPVDRKDWTPETTVLEQTKYEFTMPTEWQNIEDIAKAKIQAGEPTLNTDLVNEWEEKLEQSYAPVRNKLKQNMANYWASLFPQGGGSGRQAEANMEQLIGFETNKLERAMDMANTDLANKLASYNLAQQQLADIGGFKASADQFKSNLDASNYWNTISSNWTKTKAAMDAMNADRQWQRQSDLAKYLAEISKPSQPDFLTQLAGGLAGGLGTAGGYAGMAKLLSLIPGII